MHEPYAEPAVLGKAFWLRQGRSRAEAIAPKQEQHSQGEAVPAAGRAVHRCRGHGALVGTWILVSSKVRNRLLDIA